MATNGTGAAPAAPIATAAERLRASVKRMSLGNVRSGVFDQPDRLKVVGIDGIGKSTLGACAPKPIFLCAENGTATLDVARFPEPESFADVIAAIQTLRLESHDFRTFVVDTLDWMEPLVWAETVRRHEGWENIESPGFGKGYVAAADVWREMIRELELLQAAKGTEVILLEHVGVKNFKNPAGDDFMRYQSKLQERAAALFNEWVYANLFATWEEFTKKDGDGKFARAKGFTTGRRVLFTTRTAAWDAKNRYDLPPMLALDYAEYAAARAASRPGDPAELEAEARALIPRIADEEKRAKADAYLPTVVGNASQLAKLVNKLRGMVPAAE